MSEKRKCLLTVLMLALGMPAFGAGIDTTTAWNGTDFISSFGIPNTQTYGQVVLMPTGVTQINSFSFRIRGNTTLAFRGEIYAWDGTKATGTALYESAPVSTPSATGYQTITFTTGGVPVTAGQSYVLFATLSRDNVGHSGFSEWASVADTEIAGGSFVFLNNGTNTSQWTTTAWSTQAKDLAMTIDWIQTLPPPPGPPAATGAPTVSEWVLILMGAGLAVIAVRALRNPHSVS